MHTFRNFLIALSCTACVLLMAVPGRAEVHRPVEAPTPLPISFGVSEPYRAQVLIDMPELYTSKSKQFPLIPAGKRLVIEHVSVRGYVQTGQKPMVWIKADGFEYALVMHHQVSYASGKEYFAASQPLKLYVEDNDNLYAFAARPGSAGVSEFTVSIAGYLIDMP